MRTIGILGYLFWPREAIALIKKLEAEGTLNKTAVAEFTKGTITTGMMSLILPVLFFVERGSLNCLWLLIVSFFITRWVMKHVFRQYFLVVTFGKKDRARFINSQMYFGQVRNDFRVESDQTIVPFWYRYDLSVNEKFCTGAPIDAYYYPEGKKHKLVLDLSIFQTDLSQPSISMEDKYSLTTAN